MQCGKSMGVTMGGVFSNSAEQKFIGDRKENFEEKIFQTKTCLGIALFLPLVRAKNEKQNLEKYLSKICQKIVIIEFLSKNPSF